MPAQQIKAYFQDIIEGDCHRLPGETDNIKFNSFSCKKPDYTMMLVSTYGVCIERQNQQESVRSWIEENHTVKMARFFYKEVAANHYLYRGLADAHNRWRHDGVANQDLSIEENWDAKRWENRVFAFIITITEVNAYLAMA